MDEQSQPHNQLLITTIRWCPSCFQWHKESDFRFLNKARIRRKSICLFCDDIKKREKRLLRKRLYNQRNKVKISQKNKTLYQENEKFKIAAINRSRKHYQDNKAIISKKTKEYREKNVEIIKLRKAEYYKRNKERISEKDKIKRKSPEGQLLQKKKLEKRRENENFKKWRREYEKRKRKENPEYKIVGNLRNRIRLSVKSKSNTTKNLLGCEINFFIEYLTKQFTPEMNWGNYGSYWSVDHIIPCCVFNMENEEHQRVCFNYRNCRPLRISKNSSKGAWEDKQQEKITDLQSIKEKVFSVKVE